MKVSLHPRGGTKHHREALGHFAEGLKAHGIEPVWSDARDSVQGADLAVSWSGKYRKVIAPGATRYMALECGYVNGDMGTYGERRRYGYSVSLDGLHAEGACYPEVDGPRPGSTLPPVGDLEPWKPGRWADVGLKHLVPAHVLVLQQVPGDLTCGTPYIQWLQRMKRAQGELGETVRFRSHPSQVGPQRPLEADLAWADHAYTWCSTAAVEAVMAGVPVSYASPSAIVGPVATFSEEPASKDRQFKGDRTAWWNQLTYRQWSPGDIASGRAWEWIRGNLL